MPSIGISVLYIHITKCKYIYINNTPVVIKNLWDTYYN